MIRRLTVLYDAGCPLCVQCRDWMVTQPALVELELLPARSPEAARRYGAVPWLGAELVVVSDRGEVWAGPAAFLVALWALEGTREWSYRLSSDTFAGMAERFFRLLSSKRRSIASFLQHAECEGDRCRRPSAAAPSPYR
jgi:predicted DCC family thiol-disulfide oxidoreductase YuxK